MPINPDEVQWDETPQIDIAQVQWDTEAEQPPPPQKQQEEKGVADYLDSLWSGYKGAWSKAADIITTGPKKVAGMAIEAAAVPVSGIAGLAKTITSGPEAGGETIEQIQKFASEKTKQYLPAETAEKVIGKTIETGMKVPGVKPTIEAAMKVPEAIGDLTYEGALSLGLSPDTAAYFGAAGKSAIPVAIELLGLKGTKAAKKGLLRNVIKKAEKAEFYDEFGNLKSEMKTALKDADIGLDEVTDILPESIVTQKSAVPIAEQIKSAKKPEGPVKFGRMQTVAETFKPDIEKINAFEKLNIDYLPQHVSNDPTSRAIAENLKDIPGSLMDKKLKEIVEQTAQAADDIIIRGGGTTEKGELASRYIQESKKIIRDQKKQAKEFYDIVESKMPKNTPISTENITAKLKELSENVGGEQNLTAPQKKLLNLLKEDSKPVYGLLDRERKTIGRQLGGIETEFKTEDQKILSELYEAMTNDQETAILRHGDQPLLETYLTGKYIAAQYKNVQKMMGETIGKKMKGDITKKMGPAVKGLAAGDTMPFDELLKNIPTELGPEMRLDLVTSALNDAFIAGARGGQGKLSIGGFGSWWEKLKRQPKAMKKLKNEITKDTWDHFNALATVNNSLKETMALSQKTGKILSTAGLFEEVNKIGSRAYGLIEKGVSRVPGGRTVMGLSNYANMPRNARTMAADELLTDRRFLNLLKQQAMGKVNTPKKTSNINRLIENIKTYKKWKKSLPSSDIEELAAVGALGYFTGRQKQEEPAP